MWRQRSSDGTCIEYDLHQRIHIDVGEPLEADAAATDGSLSKLPSPLGIERGGRVVATEVNADVADLSGDTDNGGFSRFAIPRLALHMSVADHAVDHPWRELRGVL